MRTSQISSLLTLLILPLLAACTDPFSHGGGSSQQAVDEAQSVKAISYADVTPIVAAYCVRCHSNFKTYDGLVAVGAETLFGRAGHDMPPVGNPQPSATELKVLDAWLLAGQPLNAGSSTAPTPTATPVVTGPNPGAASYSQAAAVVGKYCVKCHAGFATYAGLQKHADDISSEVFVVQDMPPSTQAQPSADELATLKSWIDNGALPDGTTPPVPSPTVSPSPTVAPVPPAPVPVPVPTSASYTQASAFLKTYCVKCHGGLASYSVAKVSVADIQHKVFETHSMPPSSMPQPSADELAALEAWIIAGAPPDASVTPTPTPTPLGTPAPAKWSYISANIINAKCIKCHTATSKHGSLANYNDLFSVPAKVIRNQPDNSPLYQVLEDGATVVMPPLMTGQIVTPEERQAIHDWIANGAENDLLPQ